MRHSGSGYRRVATLLLIFLLVTSTWAEEGVLVLRVVDVDQLPVPELRIGTEGPGGSPQFTDQNGQARLRLPANTKPAALVTLQIEGVWRGVVVQFISPINRRVRVPPYDDAPDNVDEVTVAKKHDLQVLESGAGLSAVHAVADKPAGAPKPKPGTPSQGRYRRPDMFGLPHLQTVALRMDSAVPRDNPQPTGVDAAAEYFGLPPAAVAAAIVKWGGTPLLWKMILVTGTVEAGGGDPFRFVRAVNDDILFGIAPWSLRACTLQPVLLKFQERDSKRFAAIVGADAGWLKQTMSAPCEVSSKAVAERMLTSSNTLQPAWRERLRRLGAEPIFQHVAVEHMMQQLRQGQSLASGMGMASEQAIAFVTAAALQSGADVVVAQRQKLQADVAAFKQQLGRAPDEQEQLLMLANLLKPQFVSAPVDRAQLFANGSVTAFGANYDLEEFGIGFGDADNGRELTRHNDPAILAKLGNGWSPAQRLVPSASPASAPASSTHVTSQNGGAPCDVSTESQFVELINRERGKQGIAPLQSNAQLAQAARVHSAEMARQQSLSHQFPGEAALAQRYIQVMLQTMLDGENVGKGTSVAAAHSHFMNSSDHRAAILNPKFNSVGVGAACSGGTLYVTEDFAQVPQILSNEEAAARMQQALANYAAQHGITLPAPTPSPELQKITCDMATTGHMDASAAQALPGARGLLNWSTPDPSRLIRGAANAISQPISGYSLAACSVPSTTGPGVLYSIVMVTY